MNLANDFFKARYLTAGVETRVQARLRHPAIFQSPFARLVQRHNVCTTQAKVSAKRRALDIFLALDDDPHNPAARARRIDNQIKSTSIALSPSAKILHQFLRQLAGKSHSPYHFSYHAGKAYEHNRYKSNALMRARNPREIMEKGRQRRPIQTS
jgi:hypothetical protein